MYFADIEKGTSSGIKNAMFSDDIVLWNSGTVIPDLELKLNDLLLFKKSPDPVLFFDGVRSFQTTAFARLASDHTSFCARRKICNKYLND
ncbi:hypothetical protein TNCV_2882201 [Trichonephila clavipes]|nr:hypothetical protein TNCV_2882201 [Trichonephila clavipes]